MGENKVYLKCKRVDRYVNCVNRSLSIETCNLVKMNIDSDYSTLTKPNCVMNDDKTCTKEKDDLLSQFKKQVDNIFEQLTAFSQDDKKFAVNYVKKHFLSKIHYLHKTKKFERTRQQTKKVFYTCKICGEAKNTKSRFLKHMEEHIETPITCRKCQKTFNNRTCFNWHLTNLCRTTYKVLSKMYKCTQCPKEFLLQTHLSLHQAGHQRNNCTHCGLVFTKYSKLTRHLIDDHNIILKRNKFKCDQCGQSFVNQHSLNIHLQKHYKYVCIDCGCRSKDENDHSNHILIHKTKKPWQCLQCGDRFAHRQLYFNHLKKHEQYKCLTCFENFASQSRALKHKSSGHMVQGLEPRLHCPYCPSTFFRSFSLKLHLNKHKDDDTTLDCKFCNKTFENPRQYFKHCLTTFHDKNNPNHQIFVCELCGKQFAKKHIFERHLRTYHQQNSGEYVCRHCEYKTKFKPNLTRHLKLHFTKENQFMCDYCGKYFSNGAVLNDHIKYIHKEVKQLKCDKCEKSFRRKSELTRHLASHSDLRPYSCEACPNTYKRMSHLRRHEEHAHGLSKKSNRVKRFAEDGNLILMSAELKKDQSNLISPNSDNSGLEILKNISIGTANNIMTIQEQATSSLVSLQNDKIGYDFVQSLNFEDELLSIIVKSTTDIPHDVS